jgi:probable phosphoglycerate mutase
LSDTTFYIVRHGETEWNEKGILQGHLDSPLSFRGTMQAKALSQYFSNVAYDKIVSSDLPRAVTTSEIIRDKNNIPIDLDKRIRERNLGIAQGLTNHIFKERFPDIHAKFKEGNEEFAIPEGESIRERYTRSIECIRELALNYSGKRILVVTHGGVLDGIFRYVNRIPLTQVRTFSLFNASVNIIQVHDSDWNVVTWGYTDHLKHLGVADDWYRGAI